MTRPLTQIYNSKRDYSSLSEIKRSAKSGGSYLIRDAARYAFGDSLPPDVEIISEESTEQRFNVFQSALIFILASCIAALSLIDLFLN